MSIHVTNIAGADATPLDLQALLGAGTPDLAQLLRTAEMYSATDRDAALGCLTRARSLLAIGVPVCLSTSHFCKAFKERFGTSPLAHVQAKRIARAKDLILMNDRPLVEIALACGFCDQAHFSRLFRKLTGLSPSLWRKMYVTEERA